MDFIVGEVYKGFKLINKEYIDEIKADAYLLEHVKSKARVFAVKNDDNNKTFAIAFRTPSSNSKGIAHVLEHSVLNGSKKYPVKDPFAHMIKNSLNTFLDAMTYEDKTIYPISSRNKKDYFNLMNVYLDATLNPILSEDTFKQEGWHYELDTPVGELKYKGVVYNEMRARSSIDDVVEVKLLEHLYPDNPYHYNSGGDPDEIVKLSYDELKDFHKKYYHPSNSYIFLYGDAPLEEELAFLEENSLKDYTYLEVNSQIDLQPDFKKPIEKTEYYALTEEDDDINKSALIIGHVLGHVLDHEKMTALEIICDAIFNSDSSPLRKALVRADIADDIMYGFQDELIQPYSLIALMNSDPKHADTFKKIYYEELTKIVENGIDKELFKSVINEYEFGLMEERNNPRRGLFYGINAIREWLYDGDPIKTLKIEDILNFLKMKIQNDDGYFEEIIKTAFIENPHTVYLNVVPDKTLYTVKEDRIKAELDDYKKKLSNAELQKIINETKRLRQLQQTPDSKAELEKLPKLTINDISPDVEKIESEIISKEKPMILHSDIFTNHIAYIDLCFDTRSLDYEELTLLNLFGTMLISSGSDRSAYDELSRKISTYTGGIRTKFRSIGKINERNKDKSFFVIKSKVLVNKYQYLEEVLKEIIFDTTFSDTDRIKELLRNEKVNIEMKLSNLSQMFVLKKISSYINNSGAKENAVSGIGYYRTVNKALEEFNNDPDSFVSKLMKIKEKLFTKKNLYTNIVVDNDNRLGAIDLVFSINKELSDNDYPEYKGDYGNTNPNQAFYSSSQVQYVGMGINAYVNGVSYDGSLIVLLNHLNFDYLWKRVRQQGGAYGCFSSFRKDTGNLSFVSYCDPNLKDTYEVYKTIGKYIRELKLDDDELLSLIISSSNEPLLSPYNKGTREFLDYLSGYSYERRQKHKREIIDTKLDNIRAYADFFEKFRNNGYLCAIGGEKIIKKNKELFSEIINLTNK